MTTLGNFGYHHEAQRGSPGVVYGVVKKYEEEYGKKDQGPPFR